MSKEIGFGYGVLCDSLEKQANEQGYTLGKEKERLERIREAINTCMFHVATDSQVDSMFKRLQKKVV